MANYNIHIHIFNEPCYPPNMMGWMVGLLRSFPLWALQGLTQLSKSTPLRYAYFLEYALKRSQYDILQDLRRLYQEAGLGDFRFVVLTLDMDYNGAGKAQVDYLTQLRQVVELKAQHPDLIYPLLCIHPDRFQNASKLLAFAQNHIPQKGFVGIKLYPAMGFFPDDPRLFELYEWCEAAQIPILMHTIKGSVYYRGDLSKFANHPRVIYPLYKNNKEFQRNFTEVRQFSNAEFPQDRKNPGVFDLFPQLKFCFAHFGGTDFTWNQDIVALINGVNGGNNNIYTDVSYVHSDAKFVASKVLPPLKTNPLLSTKLLFGTDFYMTEQEGREPQVVHQFFKQLRKNQIQLTPITETNCQRFLNSKVFSAP